MVIYLIQHIRKKQPILQWFFQLTNAKMPTDMKMVLMPMAISEGSGEPADLV